MKTLIGIQLIDNNLDKSLYYIADDTNKIEIVDKENFIDHVCRKHIDGIRFNGRFKYARSIAISDLAINTGVELSRYILNNAKFNILAKTEVRDTFGNILGYKLLGTNGALVPFAVDRVAKCRSQLNCLNGNIQENGVIKALDSYYIPVEIMKNTAKTSTNTKNIAELAISNDFTNWDVETFKNYMSMTNTDYAIRKIPKTDRYNLHIKSGYDGGTLGKTVKVPKGVEVVDLMSSDIDTLIVSDVKKFIWAKGRSEYRKIYNKSIVYYKPFNLIFDDEVDTIEYMTIPFCNEVRYPKNLRCISDTESWQSGDFVIDHDMVLIRNININGTPNNISLKNVGTLTLFNATYLNAGLQVTFGNVRNYEENFRNLDIKVENKNFNRLTGNSNIYFSFENLDEIKRVFTGKDYITYRNIGATTAARIKTDRIPYGCKDIFMSYIREAEICNRTEDGFKMDSCICLDMKITKHNKNIDINNTKVGTLDVTDFEDTTKAFKAGVKDNFFAKVEFNRDVEVITDTVLNMENSVINTADYPKLREIKRANSNKPHKVCIKTLIIDRNSIKIDKDILKNGTIQQIYFPDGYNDITKKDFGKGIQTVFITNNDYIESICPRHVEKVASLDELLSRLGVGTTLDKELEEKIAKEVKKRHVFNTGEKVDEDRIREDRHRAKIADIMSSTKAYSNIEAITSLVGKMKDMGSHININRVDKVITWTDTHINNFVLMLMRLGVEHDWENSAFSNKLDNIMTNVVFTNKNKSRAIYFRRYEASTNNSVNTSSIYYNLSRKLELFSIYENGKRIYSCYMNKFGFSYHDLISKEEIESCNFLKTADLDDLNIFDVLNNLDRINTKTFMELHIGNYGFGSLRFHELNYYKQFMIEIGRMRVNGTNAQLLYNLCDGKVYVSKDQGNDNGALLMKIDISTDSSTIDKLRKELSKDSIDTIYFKQESGMLDGVAKTNINDRKEKGDYYKYFEICKNTGDSILEYLADLLKVERLSIKKSGMPKYTLNKLTSFEYGYFSVELVNSGMLVDNFCVTYNTGESITYNNNFINIQAYIELLQKIQNSNESIIKIDKTTVRTVFDNIQFNKENCAFYVADKDGKELIGFKSLNDLEDFGMAITRMDDFYDTREDRYLRGVALYHYINSELNGIALYSNVEAPRFKKIAKLMRTGIPKGYIFETNEIQKIFKTALDMKK